MCSRCVVSDYHGVWYMNLFSSAWLARTRVHARVHSYKPVRRLRTQAHSADRCSTPFRSLVCDSYVLKVTSRSLLYVLPKLVFATRTNFSKSSATAALRPTKPVCDDDEPCAGPFILRASRVPGVGMMCVPKYPVHPELSSASREHTCVCVYICV
jgi:hypothetical protein